ncbi:NAD(P)/FAD-dependent oxidoreductase [Athalassotoga saccharophila]|uniref:NAD(P)/FAD-dependent oxidoreductase n=1 Tax=Athalassotoga saccharophila TaxID=1441386 RepID=UPI00137B347E|nr:NAD(P)/FAD-dependent oxidoreductase [Athalassotoga saccharophila]BBJ28309.1 NADH dehydrogenase [Athalassotoga saccharophila]
MPKVVVVGGGFGGVEFVQRLHKMSKTIDITLFEKEGDQTFRTELHKFACERIPPEAIKIPLSRVLPQSVKIERVAVDKVDIKGQKVFAKGKSYDYDFLVVAAGSDPNFFGIPGMKENALSFWTLEDAMKINSRIKQIFKDVKNVQDPSERQKMLTIIVGGGGFTGVELMGEIMEWVDKLCKENGILRKSVKLMIVEALPRILPNIEKEEVVNQAIKYMNEHGVEIKTNSMIVNVTADGITLKSGEFIPTKTLIWSGGVQANSFSNLLDLQKDKRGRIIVNEFMETSDPHVYAIGDIASYVDKSNKPMPGLVESAMQSAKIAAHNIFVAINGGEKEPLDLNLHGNIVYIGKRYGVVNVKSIGTFAGYRAIIMKHIVNMQHMLHAGGFGLMWKYVKDQIL